MNTALRLTTFFVCFNLVYIPNSIGQNNINLGTDKIELTKHKDWAVQCIKSDQNTSPSCFMFQRILVSDSGESLLQMTVDKPKDLKAPRAIYRSPLGTYVQPGLLVKVDDQNPINLAIEYCDKRGCYAGQLLEPTLLKSLRAGRQIVITYQNRGRQEITLPISLIGFSSALKSL